MTNQEKKKKLQSYRMLDLEIDRLLEEKSRWYAKAMKITPSYSDLPKSGGRVDRTQLCIEQVMRIEQEANDKIDALVQLKQEIETYIQTVPDAKLRLLLQYRYIDGYKWEKVAEQMHYDYRHVTKLHGQALFLIKMP